MKSLVWLLPLLFILHDMEEIIFARSWKKKEPGLKKYGIKKFTPFGTMKETESCAIAVYEELLILSAVSGLSVLTNSYGLWFGMMAANILHLLLIHMIGSILMYRGYVPGVVTAFLTIIPCVYVLLKAQELLGYGALEILVYVVLATVTAMINLKILHRNAYKFCVQ